MDFYKLKRFTIALYGRLGFIGLIVASSSSVKEHVGKVCAFVEKEYFIVNSCTKIWGRKLILVFYLVFQISILIVFPLLGTK